MPTDILNLIGGVFVGVGIFVTFMLLFKAFKAANSRNWPTTAGELESTDLRVVIFRGGIKENAGPDSAKALITDFRYRYEIKGRSYMGSRVTFSDFVNKTEYSLKKLQHLYEGKSEIRVHYNPSRPSESVLIPGASIYNLTPLITSLGFLGVGLYLLSF